MTLSLRRTQAGAWRFNSCDFWVLRCAEADQENSLPAAQPRTTICRVSQSLCLTGGHHGIFFNASRVSRNNKELTYYDYWTEQIESEEEGETDEDEDNDTAMCRKSPLKRVST